jgi:hypothetical protein
MLTPAADPLAPARDDLPARLAWLRHVVAPRLDRFLGYYRNPASDLAAAFPCPPASSFASRPFRQYQELGLPARITGFRRAADGAAVPTGSLDVQRKEVVIENDIAWRINTLVDFTAGRAPAVTSTAKDPARRARLTAAITSLLQFEDTAGLLLLQDLVLRAAIAGSAWIHLRPTPALLARLTHSSPSSADSFPSHPGSGPCAAPPDLDAPSRAATAPSDGPPPPDVRRWLALDVVDAARLCPLPPAEDRPPAAACADAPARAALLHDCPAPLAAPARPVTSVFDRVRTWFARPTAPALDDLSFTLFTPDRWQRVDAGAVVDEGDNPLGLVPFVRYQNAPDPAAGSPVGPPGSAAVDVGLGDVEPLIGLQDELNTRLSDRASRVTMTCFRMYLGRGIDDFTKRPVGPGQMWATDNPDAAIDTFGGDADMPSEDAHITEIREALDKISGVSPVAAGLLRGKVGNLTSAVALRLTLIALLARTERKRAALTHTLAAVVRLALTLLDNAGLLPSDPADRGIDVNWPTPLPESDIDRLAEAQAKLALGVPRRVVLTELGYGELADDPGPPAPPSPPAT